jgi:predicted membrane protein
VQAWVLALTILAFAIAYPFHNRQVDLVALWIGYLIFWFGVLQVSIYLVWYLFACIVGLIRWRVDIWRDNRKGR